MTVEKKFTDETAKKGAGLYWLIVFASVFILSMLYAAHVNVTEYQYDSKNYWELTGGIFENGIDPVNILKFPKSIRGYLFPVLVGCFRHIFRGVWGWRTAAALSMAFCFSLVLPYAAKGRGIGSRKEALRTLAAWAVFMWIWGDLMQYPQSDFSACFFMLSAIACLRYAGREPHPLKKLLSGAAAGGLLYAAYNTRPTYLYSAIAVLLLFLFLNRGNKTGIILTLAAAAAGAAVLAAPQCYINNRHEGVFSPKVYYDRADNEVYKGLTTSRYETYIGDREIYARGGIIFDDLTGWQIVSRNKITAADFKLTDIFGLFFRHPLDMTGILMRHLISLMTPLYRQLYITDIYAIEPLTVIISILLWLTAGYEILEHFRENVLHLDGLWTALSCIPRLLQLIREPELGFFLRS